MTEYCDHCDKEQVEYRLCQECMDDLTGSYEEEIKDLERERDRLLAALQALVTAADDGVWHSSEDCQTEDRDDCRLCAAIAAAKGLISDGNREEE